MCWYLGEPGDTTIPTSASASTSTITFTPTPTSVLCALPFGLPVRIPLNPPELQPFLLNTLVPQGERSVISSYHRISRLIRMVFKIASAALWSLKPLFDLMVLLFTICKSAKFRRTPRPMLIDVLIVDGMGTIDLTIRSCD